MGADEELAAGERALASFDYEASYRHFAKAAKLDPDNPWAHFGMGEPALGVPKVSPQDRLAAYQRAVELADDNPPFLDAYGNCAMDLGRFQEAEKAFRRAATVDPDNAPFYLAEFAIRFWREAPGRMAEATGQEPDEATLDVIGRRALAVLLEALDMTADQARRYLG